ncbi:hypothetical protein R6Z07F_016449 [Ovis aries]
MEAVAASAGLGRVAGQVGRLTAVKVSELLWLREGPQTSPPSPRCVWWTREASLPGSAPPPLPRLQRAAPSEATVPAERPRPALQRGPLFLLQRLLGREGRPGAPCRRMGPWPASPTSFSLWPVRPLSLSPHRRLAAQTPSQHRPVEDVDSEQPEGSGSAVWLGICRPFGARSDGVC